MKNKKNKFPERLRELREEFGLSQKELSKALTFCQSTIAHWESGRRNPSIEAIIVLCDYFNCTADYIIGLSEF